MSRRTISCLMYILQESCSIVENNSLWYHLFRQISSLTVLNLKLYPCDRTLAKVVAKDVMRELYWIRHGRQMTFLVMIMLILFGLRSWIHIIVCILLILVINSYLEDRYISEIDRVRIQHLTRHVLNDKPLAERREAKRIWNKLRTMRIVSHKGGMDRY